MYHLRTIWCCRNQILVFSREAVCPWKKPFPVCDLLWSSVPPGHLREHSRSPLMDFCCRTMLMAQMKLTNWITSPFWEREMLSSWLGTLLLQKQRISLLKQHWRVVRCELVSVLYCYVYACTHSYVCIPRDRVGLIMSGGMDEIHEKSYQCWIMIFVLFCKI